VEEADEAAVAAAALPVIMREGKRAFRQPCPHFANGCCGIYEARPPVCQAYKCKLLRNVEKGAVSAADAKTKIATAKALLQSVRDWTCSENTPEQRNSLEKRLQARLAASEGNERDIILKKLLDLGALRHILMRSFYDEKSDDQAVADAKSGNGETKAVEQR
jgi:Fe-S-cluster containining protein